MMIPRTSGKVISNDVLQYVDVFLPNEREACKAAGTDDLESAIRKLSDLVPLLVVKMGRQGAIAQRGSERFTSPARLVDAVDPVGAGDSFDAGFPPRIRARCRYPSLPGQRQPGRRPLHHTPRRNGGFSRQQHRAEFLAKDLGADRSALTLDSLTSRSPPAANDP